MALLFDQDVLSNTTALNPTTPVVTPSTVVHGINTNELIVFVVVVFFLVLVGGLWYRRRYSTAFKKPLLNVDSSRFLTRIPPDEVTTTASTLSTSSSVDLVDLNLAVSYDVAAKILLGDPFVVNHQIVYQDIQLVKQLSSGTDSEVWTGYAHQQFVLVKRLLRSKHRNPHDISRFALEIQLNARLDHPNIVQFLGMAYYNLHSLIMVVEYLPGGDLAKVLRTSGTVLTWSRHKLRMARGLVSAVAYLHAQSPTIILREIKSNNILLNDALEPKLIEFGINRRKVDEPTTNRPFWTAPEVLAGKRYSEKSDIYSLGVLLTELDTCQSPYDDTKGGKGGIIHLQILNDVVDGTLRPNASAECPEMIRTAIDACFQLDPADRPTAEEILSMLASSEDI